MALARTAGGWQTSKKASGGFSRKHGRESRCSSRVVSPLSWIKSCAEIARWTVGERALLVAWVEKRHPLPCPIHAYREREIAFRAYSAICLPAQPSETRTWPTTKRVIMMAY